MNPLAIAGLIGALAGAGGGWFFTGLYFDAEIAAIKNDQLSKENVALVTYQDLYIQEVARGDTLSASLSATEDQLSKRTQEVKHAVQKATTGRACLNSATVRVLNHTEAAAAGAVPETAEPSAAESAAVATDTDVAGWIGNAQGYYDTCRARLNTLIDFEEGRPADEREQH
ncbi:MAG: hypothetical protein M0R33_07230 [Methylomonas sp.]|jgi:hypothetical protein|uniref:hypothetical protein n=1 Tax=Methylomonas sp. TaxID=418 RepID=UPI0025E9149F|nr:hypothetical protein [Methylomonas sp.]MCK9606230.1 hypothetical protein [Methylomonas sp.]